VVVQSSAQLKLLIIRQDNHKCGHVTNVNRVHLIISHVSPFWRNFVSQKKRVELENEQARRPQIEFRRVTNGVCGLERDNDIGTSN
jgi:hypothetical protein